MERILTLLLVLYCGLAFGQAVPNNKPWNLTNSNIRFSGLDYQKSSGSFIVYIDSITGKLTYQRLDTSATASLVAGNGISFSGDTIINTAWTVDGDSVYNVTANVAIGSQADTSKFKVVSDSASLFYMATDASGFPVLFKYDGNLFPAFINGIPAYQARVDSAYILMIGTGPLPNQMQLGIGEPGGFSPEIIMSNNNFGVFVNGTNGIQSGFDINDGDGAGMISGLKVFHNGALNTDTVDVVRVTSGPVGGGKIAVFRVLGKGTTIIGQNADGLVLDSTIRLQVNGTANIDSTIISRKARFTELPTDSTGLSQGDIFYFPADGLLRVKQ